MAGIEQMVVGQEAVQYLTSSQVPHLIILCLLGVFIQNSLKNVLIIISLATIILIVQVLVFTASARSSSESS